MVPQGLWTRKHLREAQVLCSVVFKDQMSLLGHGENYFLVHEIFNRNLQKQQPQGGKLNFGFWNVVDTFCCRVGSLLLV